MLPPIRWAMETPRLLSGLSSVSEMELDEEFAGYDLSEYANLRTTFGQH